MIMHNDYAYHYHNDYDYDYHNDKVTLKLLKFKSMIIIISMLKCAIF